MNKSGKGQSSKQAPGQADKVGTKTMQNLVYEELRRSLMTGVFAPGERLSLRDLAAQMGTSMMPVREAVNRLMAERGLESTPNRVVRVPKMTIEKFADITACRLILETEATRMACHQITSKEIGELEKINKKMLDAVDVQTRAELLPANYDFHFLIYRASRSEALPPLIESLWLQVGPFTYFSTPSPKRYWNSEHHLDLIRALKNKDADSAAAAVHDDISAMADYLKDNGAYKPAKLRRVIP